MKKILLDENKKFYRGNMHCHSNLSDGHFSPEELKKLYKENSCKYLYILHGNNDFVCHCCCNAYTR